ncbi:hypothetical protein ACI3KX_05740 [Microbacterium sp. ZW CA_36]
MVLVLALAALCLVGAISAIVAWARDPRPPHPTAWDYDTRHPML